MVTLPLPVAPAVVFTAHAAPIEASSAVVVVKSYNSVNVPGEVVVQFEYVLSFITCANITIAALFV